MSAPELRSQNMPPSIVGI